MFVKLFTGLPGAGKTAQLVAEIVRLAKDEPHRPIFAMGINGLQEGLAGDLTMEQLHNWWEALPPGSIIALDECQEEHLMPKDRGNPAQWVQRIAKVRHHGMTFLLTTQHPQNMSAFVRRLVDQHVHTVCKFGTSIVQRYTWGRCMDEPEKKAAQKTAVEDVGTLPKQVFDLYKSSQLHTRKARIPMKVYLLAVVMVVGIACAVSTPYVLRHASQANQAAISGSPSTASTDKAGAQHADRDADQALRQEDFAKWMRPRVDGLPWSAPMFDHLEVRAQPKLYCIAVEDGRCSCMTEQGTHYAVPVGRCRAIVADGLYNPFSEGLASSSQRDGQGERQRQEQRPVAAPGVGVPVIDIDGAPGRVERATAAVYVPPTYGKWDADAFAK